MRDPVEKEVIARSLAGVKPPPRGAARALVAEFRRDDDDTGHRKWAYASTLATLAQADVADELLDLVFDPRHGRARELLCDALKRTKDPRAPDALIALIDDDDVAGHAILALRCYGPKRSLSHLRKARAKLIAVLARPTSTSFARRQARKALERLASA